MTQGRIKRALRRKRIERRVRLVTAIFTGCIATVVMSITICLYTEAESETVVKPEAVEWEALTYNSNNELTAGVASVLINTTSVNIEKNSTNIVKSANEIVTETIEAETEVEEVNLIESGTVLYASTNVNLRDEPNEGSNRVGGVREGDKLVVNSDTGNGWVQVTYKDKTAYICSDFLVSEAPMLLVSSTAYYDEYNRHSASMRELVEGKSIAGKVSWLNRSVNIYSCNSDGTVGDFLGTYTFDDTGYGAESGVGESSILSGRTVGTIENGTCIDFYFDTESDCIQYGRKNVYIQFVD